MEPIAERYIDKSTWGPGPWQEEPDKLEWRHLGFPCLIVRGGGGALCGYVAVSPGHPWYGKHYGDVDADVHGGLTYGEPCQEDGKICHVPRPGEAETVHWLGFDCAHYLDVCPANLAFYEPLSLAGSYKTIDYVRRQVHRLAEQCAEIARAVEP